MPSVPMTSAMPSEVMTIGATWISWVRKLATSRKCGVNATLNSTRATTLAYTPYRCSQARPIGRGSVAAVSAMVGTPFGDRAHDGLLGHLVTGQLADDGAVAQHHDPVRALDQLLQ